MVSTLLIRLKRRDTRKQTNTSVGVIILTSVLLLAHISLSEQQILNEGDKHSDIYTDIRMHDGRVLQLILKWKDAYPNNTTYNVILKPVNSTRCTDFPCSLYGISKPTNEISIPENPMSYLEVMDCSYMLGCNYTMTIETSNTVLVGMKNIIVPECVMDVCSCQHAHELPKIESNFYWRNNTKNLEIQWQIQLSNNLKLIDVNKAKIHISIREQKYPSLSWAGVHLLKANYAIRNSSRNRIENIVSGLINVDLTHLEETKAVLQVNLKLIDEYDCWGPEIISKIAITAEKEENMQRTDYNTHMMNILIVVTILFVCTIFAILLYCRRLRHRKHRREVNISQEMLETFLKRNPVDLKNNYNYIDKYVEEAQAKGIADIFEVPQHAVRIEGEIGQGAYGRVFKATASNIRRMRGSMTVAVKQLKTNPSEEEIKEFLSEIAMLKGVGRHENIVCFLGCCTIQAPYMMIMEFVGRGDLLTYLRTVRDYKFMSNSKKTDSSPAPLSTIKYIELKNTPVSINSDDSMSENEHHRKIIPSFAETTYTTVGSANETIYPFEYLLDHKELQYFALQITNGMRFLEQQEITHRDLAARNILVDDNKILKISDFGLSRHGIYTNTKTRRLPLRWLSVEAIRENLYSNKSDVWAYGVVLWEIGTLGASPYPAISNHELMPYLLKGNRLEKPDICTSKLYEIMLKCWDENPKNRPSFEQLYNMLTSRFLYEDVNSVSDDYVFPPIKDKE